MSKDKCNTLKHIGWLWTDAMPGTVIELCANPQMGNRRSSKNTWDRHCGDDIVKKVGP